MLIVPRMGGGSRYLTASDHFLRDAAHHSPPSSADRGPDFCVGLSGLVPSTPTTAITRPLHEPILRVCLIIGNPFWRSDRWYVGSGQANSRYA